MITHLFTDSWNSLSYEGRCKVGLHAELSKRHTMLVKSNIVETRVFYVHHHSVDIGHMIIFYNWSTVFTQKGKVIPEIRIMILLANYVSIHLSKLPFYACESSI